MGRTERGRASRHPRGTVAQSELAVSLGPVKVPRQSERAPDLSGALSRGWCLAHHGEQVARGQDQVLLAGVLDLGAAVLAVDDLVADLDVERNTVAVVVK